MSDSTPDLMRIRELCLKALCRATGDSREAIEDAPLTRAIAHAKQVESERQRLEKAEELLQGARDYINAPEGLDAAVKIVRNIDAFLNHASNTPRGG